MVKQVDTQERFAPFFNDVRSPIGPSVMLCTTLKECFTSNQSFSTIFSVL